MKKAVLAILVVFMLSNNVFAMGVFPAQQPTISTATSSPAVTLP